MQVADDVRASIASRTFKPGERLPSGRELARYYGVAPMTINHALDVLREERLVEAHQGRGVFVLDHSAPTGPRRADPDEDSTIDMLRADLQQLAERVARIERIIANGAGSEADPP